MSSLELALGLIFFGFGIAGIVKGDVSVFLFVISVPVGATILAIWFNQRVAEPLRKIADALPAKESRENQGEESDVPPVCL